MSIFSKKIETVINSCEPLISVKIYTDKIKISEMNCVLQNDNSLLIGDIKPFIKRKYYNKGYGSRMMNKLLEYALNNGIYKVYGSLSTVDKDHEERLHHFYEKHGFKIIIYEELKDLLYAEIVKEL